MMVAIAIVLDLGMDRRSSIRPARPNHNPRVCVVYLPQGRFALRRFISDCGSCYI